MKTLREYIDLVASAEQNVTEGVWGDFKAGIKKSLENQAFYMVPRLIDLEIKGLIQDNEPDPGFWKMLKKDIADLPENVRADIVELANDVDLEISHWPRGFFGGSKNTETQRTRNLIEILRKIKNIVEKHNPEKNQQSDIQQDIKESEPEDPIAKIDKLFRSN